jgi:hypothetical protein
MDRAKLDHILRAAGDATGQKVFVLVGSAAVFAWTNFVPTELALSREADLFAHLPDSEEIDRISDELDASLGQAYPFDDQYGYYCDGIGMRTAILPRDWESRAKLYMSENTNGVRALTPEPNDIALSKLCAGREKDMVWLAAACRTLLIDLAQMRDRLGQLPADREQVDVEILSARLDLVQIRARQPGPA